MTQIKINITKANLPLTQVKYDTMVARKDTINLSSRKTTKQIKENRKERVQLNTARSILKGLILPFIAFMVLVLGTGIGASVEANYQDELNYYNVDNGRDLARAKRIEVCERVGKSILGEITLEQVSHCATMNTIITAIESANMTSRKCIDDNNCKGLKGWQNGRYGFMKFDSLYKQNIYFTEKWFTYHYKKSIHTLVYGYKQPNGEYRYGWTYTQQDTYYTFLRSKYYRVLNEIEEL